MRNSLQNLFTDIPEHLPDELFTTLLTGRDFRLERIVSDGHESLQDSWYDQERHEWILLLSGAARIIFADSKDVVTMAPGDALNIPAHARHRVDWTDPENKTVWLALHYR